MPVRPANILIGTLLLSMLCICATSAVAAKPKGQPKKESGGQLNLKGKTLGGMQFWADELVFHDWRIQRHVFTGHYRLLDDQNTRRAWGGFAHCRRRLEKLKRELGLPPMPEKVVVILHGVLRTRASMTKLGDYLEQGGGYEAVYVTYPSTRGNLEQHAKSLASVIQHLDGVEEINFVAHSLGNLVIRHYLADQTNERERRRPDARIKRIVMIGPPNNGAHMAEIFKDYKLVDWVWGDSIVQLQDGKSLQKRLAIPQCQFGIIAGGRKMPQGVSRDALFKTDGDWVLTVEETKLPGARDFALVPAIHSKLKNDPKVFEYSLRFLKQGHFISEEKRQPILAEKPKPAETPRRVPAP